MSGLYIHIPFCASRCIYCGFYSTTQPKMQDSYVDALCKEMEIRQTGGKDATGSVMKATEKAKKGIETPLISDTTCPKESISTIYLGGGTPSQLTAKNLTRLFHYIYKVYDVAPDAEVTMECNPDDITPEFIAVLRQTTVNRISMGMQTFSDKRLLFLRRRHTSGQINEAIRLLKEAGFTNISIDLMFGFPDETLQEWADDIDKAIALDVQHISAYSLMYEEGTPLYRMLEQKKVQEISEETSLAMYELLIDKLEEAGFEHYEISNFARRGCEQAARGSLSTEQASYPASPFRSRHNSSYWHNVPYIGIGAAAHSYDLRSRRWNVADIGKYIAAINRGELPCEMEEIDDRTHYDDMVTTALRTCEGIDLSGLQPRFSHYLLRQAQPYIDRGQLKKDASNVHLTRSGIFISDAIMADLMYDED